MALAPRPQDRCTNGTCASIKFAAEDAGIPAQSRPSRTVGGLHAGFAAAPVPELAPDRLLKAYGGGSCYPAGTAACAAAASANTWGPDEFDQVVKTLTVGEVGIRRALTDRLVDSDHPELRKVTAVVQGPRLGVLGTGQG